MTSYEITLSYTNLDNSLYTDAQASVTFQIRADDITHAYLLGVLLRDKLEADYYDIEIK